MAEENDSKKNLTTKSPSEDLEVPEEIRDKVLVAKFGKEMDFFKAMQQAHMIAHGSLGWQGHAELMYELGAFEALTGKKPDPKWTKEETIAVLKELVQQAHLQSIMDHAEWVTREEAEKRRQAQEVLFGSKPEEPNDK